MTPGSTARTPDAFEAFFDLAPVGGLLLAPVRDAAQKVVDFTYVRLNPAAQHLLALPECPPETFLTLYPHAWATGVFAFYCEALAAGEARRGEFRYPHDGLNHSVQLAARRVGEQLLVSFTATSDQPAAAQETQFQSPAQERAQLTASNAEYRTANTARLQ